MSLQGIDISSYQGVIDWGKVAGAGVSWAAAKASEGKDYADPTFAGNWAGMKRAGVTRGAYHFLHPSRDGAAQADFFHGRVHDAGGFHAGDFIMLDLEAADGMPALGVLECAELFVLRCREQIGRQVVLYTGLWFYKDTIGNPASAVLARCPLWLAAYQAAPPTVLPAPWSLLSFWQFSDKGEIPGVKGYCDRDTFFGSAEQLTRVLAAP